MFELKQQSLYFCGGNDIIWLQESLSQIVKELSMSCTWCVPGLQSFTWVFRPSIVFSLNFSFNLKLNSEVLKVLSVLTVKISSFLVMITSGLATLPIFLIAIPTPVKRRENLLLYRFSQAQSLYRHSHTRLIIFLIILHEREFSHQWASCPFSLNFNYTSLLQNSVKLNLT